MSTPAKTLSSRTSNTLKTKYPIIWDLTAMYSGIDDPKIFSDLAELKKIGEQFEKKHRSKVAAYSDQQMLAFVRSMDAIQTRAYLLDAYIELKFTEDTRNTAVNSVMQRVQVESIAIGNHFVFVDLELAEHPDLEHFATDQKFAPYNILFQDLLDTRKHKLSHAEETLMNTKALTSSIGWMKLFDKRISETKFKVKYKGKIQEMDEERLLNVLKNELDRNERKSLSEGFSSGLNAAGSLSTQVYNMVMLDKMLEDKIRKFEFPEQERHIENGVTKKTVDTLAEVTRSRYNLVARYYSVKRKLLKLNRMYDYDRYTPVTLEMLSKKRPAKLKKYSYDRAIEMVGAAFRRFDAEFESIFMDLVTYKHMDAEPREGKRSGAFCMFMPADVKPYVLMSYFGSNRDIMTMAHEMGHAIHDVLAGDLPFSVKNSPLTLAETASVFGEMMMFEELLAKAETREEKIVLLVQRIDDIIATIFRQISMHFFEQRAHNQIKQTGDISYEQLNQYWIETQRELYGSSVELSDGYKYWWSYIPHFIHTPFYVYAYAFGNLLVLSLYEKYKEGMPDFVAKYKRLLALGGSQRAQQAVAEFGFDLESKEFWNNGFKVFENLLQQLEDLL